MNPTPGLWIRIQSKYQRTLARRCHRRLFEVRPAVPLVSFTFDDWPRNALSAGGRILEQFGARGTYYTSLGLMGTVAPTGPIFLMEDLRESIDRGHELGCHTFAHCHSWNTPARVFEASVQENKRALETMLPGAVFLTHSYPISCPRPDTKRRCGPQFLCCRGGGQTFNLGETDLNHVAAFFLEKSRHDLGAVKKLVEETCRNQGWLVMATHDVCEDPTPYGCAPSFFEEVVRHVSGSGARILPMGGAMRLLRGENALPAHSQAAV
jgi:peptidoglycan/xylan/chitin deacetylase (PgdA/CDA1 family)